MKSFAASYEIPATVEQATALLTTQQYVEEKYRSLGAVNLRVTVLQDDADCFHSKVERIVNMREKAPGFAKKLVKEEMTVVHEIWWHKQGDTKQGGFKAALPGVNGGIEAELFLEPSDSGQAQIRIAANVQINIPLIGGKLESYMANTAAEKFEADIDATRAYLRKHLAG